MKRTLIVAAVLLLREAERVLDEKGFAQFMERIGE